MHSIMVISHLVVLLSVILLAHGQRKCWNFGIQPVTKQKFDIGESPYWNARKQKLYFVDITGGSYHSYNPYTGTVASVKTDCPATAFIIPVQGTSDNYIVTCGEKINLVKWDGSDNTGSVIRTLATLSTPNQRWNGGKVDSRGRLFTGSMSYEADADHGDNNGELYRMGDDLTPVSILTGISVPGGIEWNSANNRMFLNDIASGVVKQYVYHKENGTISNENIFFDLKAHNFTGNPAGIAIDILGDLWISAYGGSRIIHIRGTTGEVLCYLELPVAGVTGLAFGGLLLDVLYVTTSGNSTLLPDENKDAGSLFSIRGLLHIGRLPNPFKLN